MWCRVVVWFVEDWGDTFIRNVGNHPQDYTTSQSRRPQSTSSPRCESQILYSGNNQDILLYAISFSKCIEYSRL
jgi:hypothetical protein